MGLKHHHRDRIGKTNFLAPMEINKAYLIVHPADWGSKWNAPSILLVNLSLFSSIYWFAFRMLSFIFYLFSIIFSAGNRLLSPTFFIHLNSQWSWVEPHRPPCSSPQQRLNGDRSQPRAHRDWPVGIDPQILRSSLPRHSHTPCCLIGTTNI